MDGKCGGGDCKSCRAQGQTEDKIGAVAGEEGDGAEDDGDLEEGFAKIVAGGLVFGEFNVCFELTGRGLFFGEVFFPFLDMGLIFPGLGGYGCGVDAGLEGEEIDVDGEVVHADLLGLILVPLVPGAGLHKDSFGVGTVADDGDHGDENGEDGNR